MECRRLLTVVPFASLATDLYGDLAGVETRITSALNGFSTGQNSSLPFVGDHLGDAAKAISGFNTQIRTAISALGSMTDPAPSVLQNALFGALGPAGLNILTDRNGDGIGASDIVISAPGGNLGSNFSVDVRLQGTIAGLTTPLNFETGLPGLPLKIEAGGQLNVSVNYNFELAFSYNVGTGSVSLDDSKHLADGNQMALAVSVGLQNFSATATMGFVQGSLVTLPAQANGLTLNVGLGNLSTTPTVVVTGTANANLQLSGAFAGTENDFPGIDADLHLNWSIDTANPNAAAPDLSIDNVYLDLGKFLSNVVKPVFEKIQIFTHPLDPILEVLGYPLPGISDLSHLAGGDDVDLLDLGGVAALVTGFGPIYDLVHKVLDVIDKLNDFEVGETVRMKLGGFDLDSFDLRNVASAVDPTNLNVRNLTDLSPSNLVGIAQSLAQKVDELPLSDDQKALVKGFAEQLNNGFSIQFPILEHPESAVFPLLLGRDSDLFTLEAEMHLSAAGSVATGYSFFGLGIDFGGEVEIDTKFKFAYDTFGLRSLISDIAAGNTSAETIAADIVAGFYVSDDSYFKLAGEIHAGAGASIGVFSAVVGGFISTANSGNDPVSVSIIDPNNDGKLRFAEFSGNSIELKGKFSAALGIQIRIGIEVFGKFIGIKKRFDIAEKVLINFDDPTGRNDPILASQPDANGNVQLYVGATANQRRNVDQTNGNERIRIQHVETTAQGETIDIFLRQSILGAEFDAVQRISGVRSITGIGDQGDLTIDVLSNVISPVHFEGGLGHADFIYDGSGDAYLEAGDLDSYMSGGFGNNTLIGLGGNDTISLGHAGNSVVGGAGSNTIVVNAPLTQGGTVSGGDTTNNQLVVIADDGTASLNLGPDSPGAIRLSYNEISGGPYPNLILTHFNSVAVTAQDRATDMHIGDLSGAGVQTVYVNIPTTGSGGRKIELDTRDQLGLSNISLQPFEHNYSTADGGTVLDHAIVMTNATTGVTTYLMGVAPDDVTTIVQHGGTATVGPLSNDNGTIVFDTSSRPPGQNEVVHMQTPALDGGNHITTSDGDLGSFVFDADLYPTIKFRGLSANDLIDLKVAAALLAVGINKLNIDASNLAGRLEVDLLGTGALNEVTISQLAAGASIDIDGLASSTKVAYGVGVLNDILGNTAVHNVELTVDNEDAVVTSQLIFSGTELKRRSNPDDGKRPALTYDGLHGTLTVHAGAGDKLGLNQTPSGIDGVVFTNPSNTLDPLYVTAASAGLSLTGDWSLYLGRELDLAGNVTRTSKLAPIGVNIGLDYHGDDHTEIILDAALDPVGALYKLYGLGVVVENVTVGLTVRAAGLSLSDDVKMYVTGANVEVTLPFMGPVTITVDGNDRFAGANPAGANNVSVEVPIGNVALNPIGQYDSVLTTSNPIYVLASMPQDKLNVSIATSTTFSPVYSNPAIVFGYGTFISDANYVATNPRPDAWAIGTDMMFYGSPTNLASFYQSIYPGLTAGGLSLPYSIYSNVAGGGLGYQQVYLNPSSHYDPPLPTSASSGALFFQTNLQPVNSQMQMNASQLRGQLNINVKDPDYVSASPVAYLFDRLTEHRYQPGGAQGYTEMSTPGPRYNVTFGQTYVNLTHVGAETTANVQGVGNPPQTSSVPFYHEILGGNVTNPRAYVTLGDGDLSNVRGAANFNMVELTIDGRQGTQASILQLNGSSFTGWATGAPGATQTATLGTLLGTLTIYGGAADSFSILNTPAGATAVSIQNNGPPAPAAMSMVMVAGDDAPVAESMAEPATTPTVYIAGKRVNQTLSVSGNFELYVGRRLNLNGTVDPLTDISTFTNTTNTFSNTDLQTITFNFTGEGLGKLVYDVASYLAFGPNLRIQSDAAFPGTGVLGFTFGNNTYNKLVYSANTDLQIFGSQRSSLFVDNTTTATVHYYASIPPAQFEVVDNIVISSAKGPVYVTGRGNRSLVTMMPAQFSANDLRSSIVADVFITNAALRIAPDTSTSPLPATPGAVVLTSNTLTGLTGATIRFDQLKDLVNTGFSTAGPGLQVGLPRNGAASLTIVDTPVGVTTHFTTVDNVPIGAVDIQATTGVLSLGPSLVAQNPLQISDLSRREFRAASVNIGNGTLQAIHGDIYFASVAYVVPGGTVFDDHLDIARDVRLGGTTTDTTDFWVGLAPAKFSINSSMTTPLTILGSPGSHYQVDLAPQNIKLMAGAGTTVQILDKSRSGGNLPYGMSIYGAQQVTLSSPQNLGSPRDKSLHLYPSPDRPNEITELIADFTMYAQDLYLDNPGGGLGEIWWGSPSSKTTAVTYQGSSTNLTVLGLNQDWGVNPTSYPLRVVDTVAHSTTINPGNRMIEVRGTTQPLTIEYDGKETIVLGNVGNMQSIRGNVTVNVHDAALPNATVQLNNSADKTARSIQLEQPAQYDWIVSGLAPGSIEVIGARSRVSLLAGSAANTLVGPNGPTSWELTSAGGGMVNTTLAFAGMRNLTGGSANDDFNVRTNGQIAGNLDGGDGTDTVHYISVLNGTETIDLNAGILPRVGGTASNIEFVDVVIPLAVQSPGNQNSRAGTAITPLQIATTGGHGTKTYSATGLPTGLSINSATGVISGTISTAVNTGTNFNVNVTVSDETGTKSAAFSWTVQAAWFIVSPGNQTFFEGVPVNLQIPFDNPNNLPVNFSASGLPAYLGLDPLTGLITGTIYFYHQAYGQDFTFPVTITAYDGVRQQSVSFSLSTRPGFQFIMNDRYDSAGITLDLNVVNNPYLHNISLTAVGLPPGLSIDTNGHIVGTIDDLAFQTSPYHVEMTATDNTIGYSVTQIFNWNLFPGTNVDSAGDQTTYAGVPVHLPLSITNVANQEIEISAAGLPAGLSIDSAGVISGTILASAASATPYQVVVTLTNITVGYTAQTTFQWTVLPALSLDDLNANTPPGSPILTSIFDPNEESSPQALTAVTYNALPGAPTYLYYSYAGNLWVFDGQTNRRVENLDATHDAPYYPYAFKVIPGRGMMFVDNNAQLWFADAAGMRVIGESPFYINQDMVTLAGDVLYFVSYDAAFSPRLTSLSFDSSGQPVISLLPFESTSILAMQAFAGGLLYKTTNNGQYEIRWYDPTTAATAIIATGPDFGRITVTAGPNGTQNAFFYKLQWDNNVLMGINSAALSGLSPQAIALHTYGVGSRVGEDYNLWQPLLALGDQLVFSVTFYANNVYTTQFWTSDGTAGGTVPLGQTLEQYGQPTEQIVLGGSVYFIRRAQTFQSDPDFSAARLYKLDVSTGAVSIVNDFLGSENWDTPPSGLTVVGDYLYFNAVNASASDTMLWRLGPNDSTASSVPGKPGNDYAGASLYDAATANGNLYFVAKSLAVVSSNGSPTRQMWMVGPPGTAQVPGDLDGDGSVTASDIDSIWGLIQSGDSRADLNHDGSVNQADADYLIRVILNTEYGDANLDGTVDAADLATTRRNVGQTFSGPDWAHADFNGDGRSDAADLALVRRYLGFSAQTSGAPPSVSPAVAVESQPVPAAPASATPLVAQPVVVVASQPAAPPVARPVVAVAHVKPAATAADIVVAGSTWLAREGRLERAIRQFDEETLAVEIEDVTELIAKATAKFRRNLAAAR